MNCINCGAEYPNEKIPKFCIRCGNQLQKQASLIICPNCGRKSSSGGKCSNCYYVLTKREGNITRLISNISDKVDEIDKRLNTTERYVEDISRQLANKGVVAIDRVDIYEDIEPVVNTDLHYEELVSSESSITEKEVEVPLDQKVINEMKVEEETHLLNNATDNSHIDSIEEIENVIEYQPPSINLPTPTLFKFELEYIPHLEIIPMPNRARATTRVVKKSFSTNVKDFIYGPGLTGIGVIMLMIFLLLFATSLELEGATLTIIFSVFGLIMMGIGHLFVEGKFIGLKSKEPGLGILIIIVGFLISVIMAFSTMMVNPIMIIIPVLFFVIGFYLGYRNDSNTLLTLVTITAIISPLLIAQNYHVNDGIFVKLLLFGGGLIFILPLSVFTYYLGNSEKSIYPAITLLLFGPTIGISSLALSISDLVPALGIIGSITPVSLLLMRGKIELITPYLKSLFAILFIWPVVVWISQSNISNNNQLSLSLYNSLIMFLGIALNLHLCTSMQYSERISELVKSITISMDKYVRILVPSIGFLVITFEIGGNIGGLTSYT
ncbi:MAG: hypothetical protein OEY49_16675, partial [Candidatus Heimdallarchaeota archaeon]|nr:hypothetical protein [Candidatus Heimdallarchaeota archaeon]